MFLILARARCTQKHFIEKKNYNSRKKYYFRPLNGKIKVRVLPSAKAARKNILFTGFI